MRLVSRYGPPLAVMAIIFAFSAQADLSSGLGVWDFIGRKLSHITIYAILWLTVARALNWRRPIATTLVTLVYAASDEFHQSFVEGRHGTPVDVAIDSIGMAIGWALTASRAR
jgi:VanZ family protein